jgi:hypothetical protein
MKFDYQSIHLLCLSQRVYRRVLLLAHNSTTWTLHIHTLRQRVLISWNFFHHILKEVHYNFVYIQSLLQANPIGLRKVQLLGYLFSYRLHLLQKLRILLISAIGGWSTHDYVYRSLGEVRLHVRQYLIWDGLRQMLDISRQTTGSFSQPVN